MRGLVGAAAAAAALACRAEPPPVRIAVGDPLALENACACVAGYAQRDYRALAAALAKELERPVELGFASSWASALERCGGEPHLMVGKASVVESELRLAGRTGWACLARLTDRSGSVVFQGAWVVRSDDSAQRVSDLAGHRLVLGPESDFEKHGAALEMLRALGVAATGGWETVDSCVQAGRLLSSGPAADGRPVAAAVSDYALPLMVGCEAVEEGALRVVGRTAPAPFVAAYATGLLAPPEAAALQAALLKVTQRSARLRRALESRDGFVPPERLPAEAGMPQEAALPDRLPERPAVLWRRPLEAQSLGGLALRGRRLIVSDKDAAEQSDVWRCLDAQSGEPLWQVAYPAAGKMDYTGAPRATPVIDGGRVYLLGAFGDLLCVELESGREVWRCNLLKRYGGELPTWGFCGTPLLVGERLVVQTASRRAALVALDRATGKQLWRVRGEGPGYGSLIHAHLGGCWQVVGHESRALCGWDPETGRRLWQVVPPQPHDFNVPTPLRVGDLLLAATENNGARLYAFGEGGAIRPEPLLASDALSPQTASPVRAGNRIWLQDEGAVGALAVGRTLGAAGAFEDRAYAEHASLLAGARRVLAVAKTGELFLFDAAASPAAPLSRARVFEERADGAATEVWSQPAAAGGCLYLRSQDEVLGVRLF